jgi:hypothetical protein
MVKSGAGLAFLTVFQLLNRNDRISRILRSHEWVCHPLQALLRGGSFAIVSALRGVREDRTWSWHSKKDFGGR